MIIFLHISNLSIKSSNAIGNELNNLDFKMHYVQTDDSLIFQRHNNIVFQINFINSIQILFIWILLIFICFAHIFSTLIICLYIFWWIWLKFGII